MRIGITQLSGFDYLTVVLQNNKLCKNNAIMGRLHYVSLGDITIFLPHLYTFQRFDKSKTVVQIL